MVDIVAIELFFFREIQAEVPTWRVNGHPNFHLLYKGGWCCSRFVLKDITKLFVCGHSNRGCSETDACIHQSFRCAHDGPNKWCEAILMPTERVQHHVSDSVAIFKGSTTKLIHLWMRQFSRTPCIFLFLWRNFGTGRMARSINAWWDNFIWKSMTITTRLIRRGWATWFLVIAEIFVLSKDMMVPKRVAPLGSWLCLMSVFHIASEGLATYLHLPCFTPSPPLAIDAHQLFWCLEDEQRLKLQCIL